MQLEVETESCTDGLSRAQSLATILFGVCGEVGGCGCHTFLPFLACDYGLFVRTDLAFAVAWQPVVGTFIGYDALTNLSLRDARKLIYGMP